MSNNVNIKGMGKQIELNAQKIKHSQNINIGADFSTLLKKEINKNNPLQFSKHAKQRVEQRGIELTPDLINKLSNAVDKARDKGAKDVVIIDRTSSAFIVNVTSNVVITTLAQDEMKDNVFTNIDSAVII